MAADFGVEDQPEMVQCEVTGRWVPADEVVVIHGRRVCAEGKALLLDRLQSGERLPGELERPTVLRRFGALFVDGFCLGVLGAVFGAIVGAATADLITDDSIEFGAEKFQAGIGFVVAGVQLAYFALFHGLRGQTLGKMAAKIRVVNLDGSPIGMSTASLRAFLYIGPSLLASIFELVIYSAEAATLVWLTSVIGIGLVGIYGLTNVLCALLDRHQQRALHDRLAGTRVVVV